MAAKQIFSSVSLWINHFEAIDSGFAKKVKFWVVK